MVRKALTVLFLVLVGMTTFSFAQDSDTLFHNYIMNLPHQELSETEIRGLLQMREEEKLARDVYLALYNKWNLNVFQNIAKSEQTHTDMVSWLLKKYNLEDPFIDQYGVFSDSTIQALYASLVATGSESLTKGIFIGCTIEDLDIYDLQEFISESDNEDIRTVYQNLMKGSRNHMRAFYGQYSNQGQTYQAQYIRQEELENIINSGVETGFLHADGNPLDLTTGVETTHNLTSLSDHFVLTQNYPNPFNPRTTIQFSLPNMATVTVSVYDVNGRLIKTLVHHMQLSVGMHSVVWDGTDERGSLVGSGMYLYVIDNGIARVNKRMLLLK